MKSTMRSNKNRSKKTHNDEALRRAQEFFKTLALTDAGSKPRKVTGKKVGGKKTLSFSEKNEEAHNRALAFYNDLPGKKCAPPKKAPVCKKHASVKSKTSATKRSAARRTQKAAQAHEFALEYFHDLERKKGETPLKKSPTESGDELMLDYSDTLSLSSNSSFGSYYDDDDDEPFPQTVSQVQHVGVKKRERAEPPGSYRDSLVRHENAEECVTVPMIMNASQVQPVGTSQASMQQVACFTQDGHSIEEETKGRPSKKRFTEDQRPPIVFVRELHLKEGFRIS